MAEFTKTINIRSFNLGVDTSFFLTFDSDDIPLIFETVFPTAWSVTEFPKSGGFKYTAIYKSQLGFTRAELKDDIVLPASTYIPINVKQETTLTEKKHDFMFSAPTSITKNQIIAKNATTETQNFGVGFFARKVEYPPTPLLVFKGVSADFSVQTKRQTLLRGYVVSDIQENEILKTKVKTPVLFSEDITQLDDETFWRLTYNKVLDEYKIEPDIPSE